MWLKYVVLMELQKRLHEQLEVLFQSLVVRMQFSVVLDLSVFVWFGGGEVAISDGGGSVRFRVFQGTSDCWRNLNVEKKVLVMAQLAMAGAMENAETSLQLGSKLLKGLGMMSDESSTVDESSMVGSQDDLGQQNLLDP